jgi:hypothetical protein
VAGTKVPQVMGGRLGMNEHPTASWTKQGLVEVKWSLEVLPNGDPGVEGQLSKEIQGELGIQKE